MESEQNFSAKLLETSRGMTLANGIGGGVINEGHCGQPYYGHQLVNQASSRSNFTKATTQTALANQANVINLRGTMHRSEFSMAPNYRQGNQVSKDIKDQGQPFYFFVILSK